MKRPIHFGTFIRVLRKEQHLTQSFIAKNLDISPAYYQQIESGKVSPFPFEQGYYEPLSQLLSVKKKVLVRLAEKYRKNKF